MAETPHVTNEDRFAPIPEALLYDSSLPADAVRVYGVLRRHGDDPRNCYPSHARIAAKIGKSVRSVPGWIRQLERAGWVERVPRFTDSGDPDSNGYRVFGRVSQRGVPAVERGPLRADERGGSTLDSAPKESQVNESQNERTLALDDVTSADRLDAWFDEWWKAYPKKSGKLAAKKSFAKVVAKVVPFAKLIEAAARYRDDPNRDPKFTKDPATWLNAGCWDDDPLPSRSNGRSSNRAQIMGDESRTKTPTAEVVKW